MQFIKKLVILTGSGARGTLMLEKNGYGVWCKLNLFDLRRAEECDFAIISGNDLFVMRLECNGDRTIDFELGEIDFSEIHAAVISGKTVLMYGSNCAVKLSPETITNMVARRKHIGEQEQRGFISFSGRERKIEDYFKHIAPPEYNDYALADKNYYPAYVKMINEAAASEETEVRIFDRIDKKDEAKEKPVLNGLGTESGKMEERMEIKTERKMMPNQLERKYLNMITGVQNKETEKEEAPLKDEAASSLRGERAEKVKLTNAEKPEVIAMARRVTLRDYRVEGVRPTGRRATFFEKAGAQIEKLMAGNERFAAAEKLIPGSKFVKVNYDGKRYYIVGVIGKDYICYGVPSVYSEVPPEPLSGYARWLPFDESKPHEEGFWMMYQDGVSGETLKS